jgi:RimJ/RimL family protein N-acetyltransferase
LTSAPILETERLVLRGHGLEDFDEYLEMVRDADVMRYITGTPVPREQAWARMLRYPGTWALFGYGMWAVTDKLTGRFIGETGFLASKRDMSPSTEGTLEIGWLLVAEAHGKGIATEAVGAALDWADANFPQMKVTCIIDPENVASLRVAARFGFHRIAKTTYHDTPISLFERRVALVPKAVAV